MKIKSTAFANGGAIPDRFSKYHDDYSPPLDFEDVPAEARSLALIVDDPDAPRGLFTHWIAFDIDARARGFRENDVPREVHHGRNSFGDVGYGGPKPPDREHRYFFHLYALDSRPALKDGASREEAEKALKGHVIAEAEYMGRYAPPA